MCKDVAQNVSRRRKQERKKSKKRRVVPASRKKEGAKNETEGPGIEFDEGQRKHTCGREAAAALHSAVKDDNKKWEATVHSNPDGKLGKPMQHK